MITRKTTTPRRGAALIMAIVAMAILSIVLAVVTSQIVTQRQMVRQRHCQLQAEWLARAGIEHAAARLLDQPAAFTDDQLEATPETKLRIVVEKSAADTFVVTAEAQVISEGGRTIARESTQRFRRTQKDGIVRLQVIEK